MLLLNLSYLYIPVGMATTLHFLYPAFVIDFPDQSIDFDIVVLNGNFGFVFAVVEGEGGDGAFESGAGYFFVLGFCRDFCHVEGYVSGFGGVVGGVYVVESEV